MKIAFKIYSWVWIVVLFLYSLKWSEFSEKLDLALLVFLLFTIAVSFFISMCMKPITYKKECKEPKCTVLISVVVAVLFMANFFYAGYIPLFGISSGDYSYVSFPGIPTIYPLVLTFSVFYYFYLLYMFLSFGKRKYIICALIIAFMHLLVFSRYVLVLFVLGTGGMLLVLRAKKNKFEIKYVVLIVVLVLGVCYLFGCLGNIRSGSAWNDCSYIEHLGMYTNWPSWIPKQYMWVYSYIISPLANLNYNVVSKNEVSDISRLIVSYIPEFISKRYFPDLITTSQEQTLLIRTYFNAQTTFVESYYCMGMFGCYVTYFLLVIYTVGAHLLMRRRKIYSPVILIAFSSFLILSFFYNVFYYTMTSMFAVWSILYAINHTRRFRFKFGSFSLIKHDYE